MVAPVQKREVTPVLDYTFGYQYLSNPCSNANAIIHLASTHQALHNDIYIILHYCHIAYRGSTQHRKIGINPLLEL